ncbi:MAG: UDP-N-acetylmuramoyl-L-alanine--D-glutamate ligase [Verrucomicrobiales bacterium]
MLDLHGQKIAVLGAGRSGRAAASLARACGAAEVTIYDGAEEITDLPEGVLACPGADVETGRATQSDLVVLSPGITTESAFVRAFAANSGVLWGEIELAYRCFGGEIVAITGTNGKTTTTELVETLVRAGGRSCVACGNYGRTFSEVVLAEEVPEVVALELSSFQLETVREFRAKARIWLNFSADHMDRYATLDEYRSAKMRIFERLAADDLVVARAGEELGDLAARVTRFSAEEAADWSLREGVIMRGGEELVAMERTRLYGRHNAENVMAAWAAAEAVSNLTAEAAREALRAYAPPKHRCELIRTLDGVFYLNDSKATNLHAMESAIKSQDRPIVLIAGGKEKGLDYGPAAELLAGRVREAVVFGEIGEKLRGLFSSSVPTTRVATLAEAVAAARAGARAGEVVLFSPGTSSFDQFSGYEARGDAFRELVLNFH